ncbi:MAG TPA: hypothetical protein VGE93_12795 [Bryobacteraceae bacterium]
MPVTINGESVGRAKRVASAIQFPYSDMSDALNVSEGLLKGGGVSLTRDQLAAAMGLAPRGGGFATKIATAKMFGVIDTNGGKYELTDLGFEIVDASRQGEAKIKAFLNVPLYKRIYDEFRGKLLPPRPHGLERAIVNFGVTEKNARQARQAFERSARIAGFYPGGNEDRLVIPFGVQAAPVGIAEETEEAISPTVVSAVGHAVGTSPARGVGQPIQPLEYQLVDLLKTEGITEEVSQAIWTLVRFLSSRGKGGNA